MRYSFITKSSGKPAKIMKAATREQARAIKRGTTRNVAIYDNVLGKVVR